MGRRREATDVAAERTIGHSPIATMNSDKKGVAIQQKSTTIYLQRKTPYILDYSSPHMLGVKLQFYYTVLCAQEMSGHWGGIN